MNSMTHRLALPKPGASDCSMACETELRPAIIARVLAVSIDLRDGRAELRRLRGMSVGNQAGGRTQSSSLIVACRPVH